MIYDTIEFYLDDVLLGKTCLPESTGSEVRRALAKHLGIKRYNRMKFISGETGIVRFDSNGQTQFEDEFEVIK